jgi:hypothetical protein
MWMKRTKSNAISATHITGYSRVKKTSRFGSGESWMKGNAAFHTSLLSQTMHGLWDRIKAAYICAALEQE